MRSLVLALLLVVPLLAVPAGSAAAKPVLEDASGDSRFVGALAGMDLPPQDLNAAGGSSTHADLVSLSIEETEDVLTFVLAVASLEGEPSTTFHEVYFAWGSQDFVLTAGVFESSTFGLAGSFAALYRIQGEDWDRVATFSVTADKAGGTLSVPVPKVYVMDGKGRVPGRGDALTGFTVESQSLSMGFGLFQVRFVDRTPDEGKGGDYVLQLGDFSQGSIRLAAPERVRVSNGGSTTFVYSVTVTNAAETEDEVSLGVVDVPEGWNISVQSPVRVPGKSDRTVALLASVPFAHDHGGFTAFNLTAQSRNDPASGGRMRLGVLHTPIPQPTGHHSDLFLHAAPRVSNPINNAFNTIEPYGRPSMSTVSTHEGEVPYASTNYFVDGSPGWWIPLSPGLQMGLDFDLERTGTLTGAIENVAPGEGELLATLYLIRENGDEVVLAEADPIPMTFEANKAAPFSVTLVPTEEADYVPHEALQNMVLTLTVDVPVGVRLQPVNSPHLMVEPFKMSLPLNEYHDRLTGMSEASSVLELVADGLVEKSGRPGTIMTYGFTLKNRGSAPESVEIDVAGADSRHADVVPRGTITLAPQESRKITLALSVPPAAAEGEEFEALLFVHGTDDPSKTAIARTKTRVTLAGDANPDESAVLIAARDAERDTPLPALPLLAAALVAATLLARRRR